MCICVMVDQQHCRHTMLCTSEFVWQVRLLIMFSCCHGECVCMWYVCKHNMEGIVLCVITIMCEPM